MLGERWHVDCVVADTDAGDNFQLFCLLDNATGEGCNAQDSSIIVTDMLQDVFLGMVGELLVGDIVPALHD